MIKVDVSIVISCYNEQEAFSFLREKMELIFKMLEARSLTYECLLIDDGSKDLTWVAILDWSNANLFVRGIHFSRNFGHQAALTCGYEVALGDAIITIDADLQDPPELILEMIEKYQAGADIVLAVRKKREAESAFKRITAYAYYRTLHLLGLKYIERNCGDFRLMNRKSVDALNSFKERFRMLRALTGYLGYKVEKIYFDRKARVAGETKYPLGKMLVLAMDGIISFSAIPLRFCYVLAGIAFLTIFAYVAYVSVRFFCYHEALVPGWTSLMIVITLFGSFNLFCLGIMGEYIGRIYGEVKARPLYIVKTDTKKS